MSRRKRATQRKINPDPRFGGVGVAKFINQVMVSGKKSVAESVVYGAFDIAASRLKIDAGEVLNKAMEQVEPEVEVQTRRVGGATYPVPIEVRPERKICLAMRWIISAARKRPPAAMEKKLADELVDAAAGKGAAVKKRDEMHKVAEANKAFSHFRF